MLLKNNEDFYDKIEKIIHNRQKPLVLLGKEGFGKTTYARKLCFYLIERLNGTECVYVNCKGYNSVAEVLLKFQILRHGKIKHMV